MSSCFGFRKSRQDDTEPLLPRYRDDTALQHELHKKLHTYQMVRALGQGFMPSNEQIIVNLRTVIAADVLNPDSSELSESGRLLVKYSKQWLKQFMELLQRKNHGDEVQDFIWYLSRSRVKVDVGDISQRASRAKAKADSVAAYQSLRTVGSLLLTNSDFRLFLSDLNVLGREVFRDTAFTLSNVAERTGKTLEPSERERKALQEPGKDVELVNGTSPSDEVQEQAGEVAEVVAEGAAEVAKETVASAREHLQTGEGETLLNRLKQAVFKLRQRPDYRDSVSTLSLLVQQCVAVYSQAAEETVATAEQDVKQNAETDRALRNFWSLLSSFGERQAWQELQQRLEKVASHKDSDPDFERLVGEIGRSVQAILTDPAFFDQASSGERLEELKQKTRQVNDQSASTLRSDIDALLAQAQVTFRSVLQDQDVAALLTTSTRLASILHPENAAHVNTDLFTDALNVFIPLLVSAIQYLPIPRLEVSTPEIDLLLENVIVQPGRTINATSFLPHRLRVETRSDVELRRTHTLRTVSRLSTAVTVKLDGVSLRADDVGFWLRARSGLVRYADAGLASVALDERGIDVHLDVDVGRDRLEQVLTLRAVRVHVHKLQYELRRSKLSWLAWLFRPLLRPVLRRTLERQLALAVADLFHAANRELLFARERLRATRVADPDDLLTFVRAVAARLVPAPDPDVYARVGVGGPGEGVFRGVYAPGSLAKVWEEEGRRARERIEEGEVGGWRNGIFDVHAVGGAS